MIEMNPRGKLRKLIPPPGKTRAQYLAERMNELGSIERLAVEEGVSYGTMQKWVSELVATERVYRPREEASA